MKVPPKPKRSQRPPPPERARNAVLAQWRGIDIAPLEKAQANSSKPIAALMPQVLKGLGLDRRRSDAEIAKVWNHSIDPAIVAHAQPTGLHKGTLFVTVDNSVWLSEIVRYRSKEVLERLQLSFGRDLILRVSYRLG